jgi:hypothetical protein
VVVGLSVKRSCHHRAKNLLLLQGKADVHADPSRSADLIPVHQLPGWIFVRALLRTRCPELVVSLLVAGPGRRSGDLP